MAPEGAPVQAGRPVLRFDTSDLERRLVEKLAEQSSAQKELEKRQASLAIALRDSELQLAEAAARRRRNALKVAVPPELVAAQELRQARLDLALAEREIAYRTESLRFKRRQGETEQTAAGLLTAGGLEFEVVSVGTHSWPPGCAGTCYVSL